MIGGVWQQGEVASAFDGERQAALVPGAGAGLAARVDLPALRDEAPELARLLVVDVLDLVDAEGADFAPAETSAPAAAATTAAGAARAIVAITARAIATTAATAAFVAGR